MSFVIRHQLQGMLDGTVTASSSIILIARGVSQPNPTYSYKLQIDKLLRIGSLPPSIRRHNVRYAILSMLYQSGMHLASCFNTASSARVLDLKFMLTNVSKGPNQSMEDYLRHIKTLADSLAPIQNPISDLELIQFTTFGIPPDYHTFVLPIP